MKPNIGERIVLAAACFCLLLLSMIGRSPAAEKITKNTYTVSMLQGKIKVDGILNEEAWKGAPVIPLAYEWTPGDNVPPPVKSEFMITYSEDFLYLAFRCFDPEPSQIRAHLMDRDAVDTLIQDDHVVALIDPFNDERRGFQFRVNPLGVQADANFSENEGYEDFSWDAIWNSAGRIEEWGYAVEIAIPWSQLRFPSTKEPQTWGISVERSYPRSLRYRIASNPRRRGVGCILCQADKVTGFSGMKTGWNVEADPTLTMSRTDRRSDDPLVGMENGKVDVEPGLTLRWGMTSNLVLNAAVNPDFSQVEADVAQLDVNRRFAIRFPEKRTFFLEGGDFFLTPIEAVFTRTVASPYAGFKLTGKQGKNALGLFVTYDRMNNLLLPSNQESQDYSSSDNVLGGVLRFRRDLGKNSTLGILYTGRAGQGYSNQAAGVDGFFRLSNSKTLMVQYLHSETRYPEALVEEYAQKKGSFGGDALEFIFGHVGRNWHYGLQYEDLWPGFRADFGYVPRVDYRFLAGGGGYQFWGKPKGWFTAINTGFEFIQGYDHANLLTDRTATVYGTYRGPLQSMLQVLYSKNREIYAAVPYDLDQVTVSAEVKPAKGVLLDLAAMLGDAVDYVNARSASQLSLQSQAEVHLGRHLQLVLRNAYQRLSLRGETVFTANLSQVNLVYNLNVRAFVRAIVQYLDLSRNLYLYAIPMAASAKTLFTQFLFSYKLNPQTVLFIGYSDNSLGSTGVDTMQIDRTFFVKIGYAWLR